METNDYLQFFGILIMFFVVLYGAYYVSRYIGGYQKKRNVGNNMSIIEVIPVGQQKTLQLVRIGDAYMIIGVTRDQITFIQNVDSDNLTLDESNENVVPFSNFLSKLMNKNVKGNGENSVGEEFDDDQKK